MFCWPYEGLLAHIESVDGHHLHDPLGGEEPVPEGHGVGPGDVGGDAGQAAVKPLVLPVQTEGGRMKEDVMESVRGVGISVETIRLLQKQMLPNVWKYLAVATDLFSLNTPFPMSIICGRMSRFSYKSYEFLYCDQ